MYEWLMARRNRAWVERIEALTYRNHDVLVIVGAGHLVGPENLIQLLEEKNYTPVQR